MIIKETKTGLVRDLRKEFCEIRKDNATLKFFRGIKKQLTYSVYLKVQLQNLKICNVDFRILETRGDDVLL